jgi:SpoVK/Ycf46/Vps4 family AAA+-type ATPase
MSEEQANVMVDELIYIIKNLIENKNPLADVIKKPNLLFEALNDLKNMIEMINIKISVVEQIKYLITNKARNNSCDNHMLHTVIYGESGVGKTSIARILAKIWISLDMIKKPTKKSDKSYTELLEKAVIENDYKIGKLNKGLSKQVEIMNKLRSQVNGIKNGNNNDNKCSKILTNIRDARYNLDKMVELSSLVIEEEKEEDELNFVVVTRDQLVAGFLGQTSIKTRAVLEKALGKVLLIDEAYSLFNSDRDSFGEECLTVINEFMSLHSDEIIIIFAGYKDLIMNTIFKVQPGLQRRCQWFYDVPNYTQNALTRIFKKQLEKNGWLLDSSIDLNFILKKYKNVLKNPGDTDKLVLQAKLSYSEYHFDNTLNNQHFHDSIITEAMIIKAIEKSIRNNPVTKVDLPPAHMYL